jgi:glutamate N-acetyltransferase/amino-acid N-acetyltransferase
MNVRVYEQFEERSISLKTDGVTAAKGFVAVGIHCGIKKIKKDLAILYTDRPAITAGVFTKNVVVAAPVVFDRQQLQRSSNIRAITINSGNANACTGEQGMLDAIEMARVTAEALNISQHEVLVSSTGVIGKFLPMEKIKSGIEKAAVQLVHHGHADAARAIMTTDTFSKEYALKVEIDGKTITIGGMAKGSGMIAPNMATMLAFITTDASIAEQPLQAALQQATDRSFNRISVDGDMSTNDMAIVMANGMAGNAIIETIESEAYKIFYRGLEDVLVKLSKMIVLDGEGATKFIEVNVVNAANEAIATQAARSVSNSNLVKTAFNGEDANWGRILAAIGYSGIDFKPEDVEIWFGNVPILRKNYDINFSEEDARKVLSEKEIVVTIALNQGNASASFWTCDLSKEYVAINANYRT